MQRSWWVCAVLAAVAMVCALPAVSGGPSTSVLRPQTFAKVKSDSSPRLVLFHFSTDDTAKQVLGVMEQTAKHLTSLNLPELSSFQFEHVDCSDSASASECSQAGFQSGKSWLFTSLPGEGIQQYTGERDLHSLARHVRHKFLPAAPDAVLPLSNEQQLWSHLDSQSRQPPRPVLLKCYEKWCTHCKALGVPYQQAAGFFRGAVDFMEVECSSTAETRALCARQGVSSFPTLILFTGESKHTYDRSSKAISELDAFFLEKLPAEQYDSVLARSEARASSADEHTSGDEDEAASKQANKQSRKEQEDESEADDAASDDNEEEAVQTSRKQKKSKAGKKKKKKGKDAGKKKKQSKRKSSRKEEEVDEVQEEDEDEAKPKKRSKSKGGKKSKKKQKGKKQKKSKGSSKRSDESDQDMHDEL